MSFDEGRAEAWLARGIEAYQKQCFTEAAEHFEKAAALEPGSVQAHLALGATLLTLYKERLSPPSPDCIRAGRDISEAELRTYREQQQAILAEQNSTRWTFAEGSLKRAHQPDPQNQLVLEYLCVLYSVWRDPLDEKNDRMEEAKQWLERLAELYPEHTYANFYCGMLLATKARNLLPHYGKLPPLPEPDLASLRTKAGPLLAEAKRHLSRALSLDRGHRGALHFIDDVASMQVYLADPEQAARDLREKLEREFMEVWNQVTEDHGQLGPSTTITFHPSPEALAEAMARPFPPNPWWI